MLLSAAAINRSIAVTIGAPMSSAVNSFASLSTATSPPPPVHFLLIVGVCDDGFVGGMPEVRRRLVSSIVRVDHAGELSADRIYVGQLAVLRHNVRVAPVIEHMWEQEREHLDTMERLLAKHNVRPTIFAPLCSLAGYALGAGTALIGEKGAMACTIAIEELIGGHYNDQIKELVDDDLVANAELLKTLSRLRDEELEHHDTGVAYQGLEAPFYRTLKGVIQTGCRAAIWVTQRI